ncbi:hypothetical protein M413DRAFT_24282 [Hebeloma cylindrosporum]|uniref:Uncharacterized protein n=1 Tax=Hebeloma cylindrosporum TaxID=76867 RepID=A0A0C3CR66_HEBCY|nr:hypothetical protein M413DRAFT_27978 [Hebeloma cylindrosporum h7]KIM46584.1 hypothetical protein M413DRAFT_24282 [Hebeloma cylindrosporum h7]
MPALFFPANALEYLRSFTSQRFTTDLHHAEASAWTAADSYLPDHVNNYIRFVQKLENLYECQQLLVQLHMDPTVPEEVLKAFRQCIHPEDVVDLPVSLHEQAHCLYKQIINLNVHQCYIDHDQPVGDELNVRAELFLEAAQVVEEAFERMGGDEAVKPPIEGISEAGEAAVQSAYCILQCISDRMNAQGRVWGMNQMWWNPTYDRL